jgi:hypothetical protein
MLCGLILYYGIIPLEFLITGDYRVRNDFLDAELAIRSLIDGWAVVICAFLGFWLGTQSLARLGRNEMVRASTLGACAARMAMVLIAAFLTLALFTGISSKASDVELSSTMDTSYDVAFNSLVLSAASAVSAVAALGYAYNATTRRRSAMWVLAVLVSGGIGLSFGDKDPLGASVFMCIASLALWLRRRAVATMVACSLCIAGLFAISAVSMVKFMLFGINPDLSLLLVRPSNSDPGGAFALMATAMEHGRPLGMTYYEPLVGIWQDVCSAVPRFIWSSRPRSPGTELASFLMGPTFVEGYGVGYSPYLDVYCAFGYAGIAVAGAIMGWAVALLLRLAACVDSTGHLVLVCAMINFYVLVVSQRLSLVGSLKQLLYYNATTISVFFILSAFEVVRSAADGRAKRTPSRRRPGSRSASDETSTAG